MKSQRYYHTGFFKLYFINYFELLIAALLTNLSTKRIEFSAHRTLLCLQQFKSL